MLQVDIKIKWVNERMETVLKSFFDIDILTYHPSLINSEYYIFQFFSSQNAFTLTLQFWFLILFFLAGVPGKLQALHRNLALCQTQNNNNSKSVILTTTLEFGITSWARIEKEAPGGGVELKTRLKSMRYTKISFTDDTLRNEKQPVEGKHSV